MPAVGQAFMPQATWACLAYACTVLASPPVFADALERGRAAFQRGALEEAVREWQDAAEHAALPRVQVEALVNLAGAYHWLGQPRLSSETSARAITLAEPTKDRRLLLLAKSSLGVAGTCGRQADWAERRLREALTLAEQLNDPQASAAIWNNLGNVLAEQGKVAESLDAFRQAATLAGQASLDLSLARARCNAAAIAARAGKPEDAAAMNGEALDVLATLNASHEQVFLLIRAGRTDAQVRELDRARRSYRQALTVAERLADQRAMSYALGYLGKLEQSLELTRQAILVAQQIPLPEALYKWEWQMGRLLRTQGDRAGAVAAYRRAVQTLEPLRGDLALGCGAAQGSFQESVGPVYWELADLLLQAGELHEARETIERLKSAELENYLRDECARVLNVKPTPIERLGTGTAVVYIIPLPDRTELLMSIGAELHRFRSPATAAQLDEEVRRLRSNLENRTTSRYLEQAQQLDQWLIAPMRETLATQGVSTLVFVPDGLLRTIPMAALYDGERFLIERYAVAVTPGLQLLGPRPMPRAGLAVLAAGLSAPVAQSAPLPYAAEEVRQVRELFGADSLLDDRFLSAELRRNFAEHQYNIVHLATHGEVSKDASQSYILTYDGKLTLDELAEMLRPGKFRGQPVELLTLSACQTAAGDDRAALGLAGVAVRAGARSALATLWFVHDQSTALLMGEFYEGLRRASGVSKAQALQRAQIKLLQDPRYEHAGYWSPYLMIGNWL